MGTQDDSNALFEKVIKSYANAYFPHLRNCTERFVDFVNHTKTQQNLSEKFYISMQEICKPIEECIHARSLYDKLVGLKTILSKSDTVPDPTRMFKKLQNFAFSGLLSVKEFFYLQSDGLSLDDGMNEFLRFIDEDEIQNIVNDERSSFYEYLESWTKTRQEWGWSDSKIREASGKLREEFESVPIDNSKSLEKSLFEISEACQPLHEKLHKVEKKIEGTSKVAGALSGIVLLVVGIATGLIGLAFIGLSLFLWMTWRELTDESVKNTAIYDARAADIEWYERTLQFIKDYLRGKVSENNLKQFIKRETLEPDLVHFNGCINPWLGMRRKKIESLTLTSFHLPKALIMKEIDRISAFFHAVILNKPEMLQKHLKVVDDIIQDAGRLRDVQSSDFLYPLISFGQLPLPSGESKCVVKFQFVLDNSLSKQSVNNVLTELENLFSNITANKTTFHGNVPVIQLDLHIDDNITTCIIECIKKLADLKVRSILIGEFGHGRFPRSMIHDYNHIYSFYGLDKAKGFIPRYFSGLRNRGGEPYFCPNGWRRYSIDVGLTRNEFESKYGDWPVAYHGTEGHTAISILLNGLRASGIVYFISTGESVVYLSPSIEYSGHPRYARVWKVKWKYVQMVLQVRVNPCLIFQKKEGSLPGSFKNDPPIDMNFEDNKYLQWVIKWPAEKHMKAANGILVYGIMLRVTYYHPGNLSQNKWWEESRPGLWDFF